MRLEHALHRRLNTPDLCARDRIGHARDRGLVEHLAIGAYDAREALTDEIARRGPPIGSRTRVVGRTQIASPHMNVACKREAFG